MNYITHAIRFLERPHFIPGTATPDWLSAVDRAVRLRERQLAPLLEDDQAEVREFAAGVLQHFHDDDWFHSTRGFAEITSQLTTWVRDAIGPGDGFRCGLLGHIAVELLLDSTLHEECPGFLTEYYARIETVDSAWIQQQVNRVARKPTDQLQWFVPLFLRERVLEDYADDRRLWRRLNQIWRRIKLGELPEGTIEALRAGRALVRERWRELLPETRFQLPHSKNPLPSRAENGI